MATAAVLETAELLENILYELDTKTLLLSRRVRRQWMIIIDSSPELQQKLFYTSRLRPHDKATQYLWTPKTCHLEPVRDQNLPDHSMPLKWNSTRLLTPMSVNPLLSEELLPLGIDRALGPADQGERLDCISIHRLLRCPYGSWKEMFLCQPPATRILARHMSDWLDEHKYLTIEDPSGVRMSHVVEKIKQAIACFDDGPRDQPDLGLGEWRLAFPGCVDFGGEPLPST